MLDPLTHCAVPGDQTWVLVLLRRCPSHCATEGILRTACFFDSVSSPWQPGDLPQEKDSQEELQQAASKNESRGSVWWVVSLAPRCPLTNGCRNRLGSGRKFRCLKGFTGRGPGPRSRSHLEFASSHSLSTSWAIRATVWKHPAPWKWKRRVDCS